MAIFPKFFEAFMSHIIRLSTGKKTKLFCEFFTNNIFEYSFVLFFSKQSLISINTAHVMLKIYCAMDGNEFARGVVMIVAKGVQA